MLIIALRCGINFLQVDIIDMFLSIIKFYKLIILVIVLLVCIRILYGSIKNTPIIDGDEIYIKGGTNKTEASRFNYVTKECKHGYAIDTVNDILSYNKPDKKVLILGVSLGAQIIHLLDKDPKIKVTGVDLEDTHFDIVRKYSDVSRLRLIKMDAYKYIIETKDTYDVIMFDVFKDNFKNPEFLASKKFLEKIHDMLQHTDNSKFIINTPKYNIQLNSLLKEIFYDYNLNYKKSVKSRNSIIYLNKRF
jgi:hypothetical protein